MLSDPTEAAVRESFTGLPRRGCIEVRCRWERRLELQRILSEAGAFAICLKPLAGFDEVLVTALKGKAGACFETGRSATYAGAALAVMDDDHHLVAGAIRVCEKTGGLYTLPPYRGLLTVTEADAGLLARLETDPVPFDCNTFEPDAERLANRAFIPVPPGDPTTAVFYPGPFNLLVLRDGALLRRGCCTLIATRLVKALQEHDGVLIAPPRRAQEAEQPVHYPAAYRSMGAGCLLDAAPATAVAPAIGQPGPADAAPLPEKALTALAGVSDELRRRLLRLIERSEPYFILTGSDPRDPGGCCPSALVGETNRLVDAGLLACHREYATADSCTATLYAFAGEITLRNARPVCASHTANRRAVATWLTRMQS